MKIRGNISISLAIVAASTLLLLAGGCTKVGPDPIPDPTPDPAEMPRVELSGTINATDPTSKLTQSTTLAAGLFEANDMVGVFLFDQNVNAYSYANVNYKADAGAIFRPDPIDAVFYKTYYTHNIHAYFPYAAGNADPTKVAFGIKADQGADKNYIACDFLSSLLEDIKPQQINPTDPALAMHFDHQMTSLVIKVKYSDGSAIVPTPVVKIQNTKTAALLDITKQPAGIGTLSDVKDVTARHNAALDLDNTLFYEAIVMPQALAAGSDLISIYIGDTRSFHYKVKSDDPIFAGGLSQGKEHVFELTINGTELKVQGGEIAQWGTGATMSHKISGGGVTTSKMFIQTTGTNAQLASIVRADIAIDNISVVAEVSYDDVNKLFTCTYKVPDWQYDLKNITFKNSANAVVLSTQPFNSIRITGNPTTPAYDKHIATVDLTTGQVTAL